MFISEDDPFRFTGREQSVKINVINQNSTFHSNNNSLERGARTFDTSFTDFTQTISKCLYKGSYLQNQVLINPFCPLCSKFVGKNDVFTICEIKNSQMYIMHDKCLLANPSFQMSLVIDQEDDMLVVKNEKLFNEFKSEKSLKSLSLQFRQFLIEIIFYHPISEKKFGKIQKKQKITRQNGTLKIKLSDLEIKDQYSPNMIVLPLTDYKLQIGIHEIGEDRKQKITKYINFKKISNQSCRQIIFGNQQIQLQIKVCKEESQKENVLEQMNYKYVFPSDKTNLIVVQTLCIKLPEQFQQSQSDQYDQMMQSSSSKLLEFLEIDGKLEEAQSHVSRKTSRSNVSFSSINSRKGLNHSNQLKRNQSKSAENADHQKVNLDKLIKSDGLKDFVRHNTQSRSFQSFLDKASNEEIDRIIDHMKSEFSQLMKHQYGNYMMQKLFSVCNLERRYLILQILIPQLSDIVMNKQGTHAFQDFLSFFTTEQEHVLILNKIRENFYQLCIHSNATHFIQKIIKIFSLHLLNQFFYYCVQNLYQFGCDKNGMCVVKHMLKKLKQISDKSFDKIQKNEQNFRLAQEYKKLFVQGTLFNLDAIIGDMYGNYVVQFNFELFQPNHTSTLTDSILMKLPQYSLSKYSTNVVYKCLSVYWSDNKEYVSSVLKEVFQPYLILEMHKNKDGNKILLQLMQKYEGYQVWNRLYNTLINTEPARFYHDRWGSCLGCRSGNVGGNWSNFSDAVQKLNSRKKNNKFY